MNPPPRLPRHPAPWVLLVLLLAVPATAASWQGELATPDLQALGESSTRGALKVLLQENARPEQAPADAAFHLRAEHIRVESDHTDLSLNLLAAEYRHDAGTSVAHYDDAVVDGVINRGGHLFSVWPTTATPPTVRAAEGGCAGLAPSGVETRESTAMVWPAGRPPNVAVTGSATTWTGCDQSSLTVTGDFLLRLWEWDAELLEDGASIFLPSGKRGPDGSPSNGDVTDESQFAGQATEQYLYARNATLTIPRLAGHHEVYLEDAEVTASVLRLREATGTLQGDRRLAVQQQDLYLRGDLTLRAQNVDDQLATLLQGGLHELRLDGVTATIAPAPEPPNVAGLLLALLATLTIVMVVLHQTPLAAYHLNRLVGGHQGSLAPASRRERRGTGLWVLSRIDNHLGWHRRSWRHAVRAHRAFPLLPEAKLMVGVAASHLGRHETALVDFADAYTRLRSPTARAMAACAAAEASCRLGDPDLAREWLRDAARDDPAFTLGRVRRRRFDSLADHDWFPAWQRLLAQRVAGTNA